MTTTEILRAAKAKIEDPARWTQRSSARDIHGAGVLPDSEAAVCWCGYGAVRAICSEMEFHFACHYLDLASAEAGHSAFQFLNDRKGHSEVMTGFDRAIELSEAAQ